MSTGEYPDGAVKLTETTRQLFNVAMNVRGDTKAWIEKSLEPLDHR